MVRNDLLLFYCTVIEFKVYSKKRIVSVKMMFCQRRDSGNLSLYAMAVSIAS